MVDLGVVRGVVAVVGIVVGCGAALADEGMWLLNSPPWEMLEARYGVELDEAWFEHQRGSAVRFGFGGSASFISPDGLVITNHHVADGQLAKLSTPERDLVEEGFLARSRGEELRFPDAVVNVLQGIEDVTARVKGAAAGAGSAAEAEKARRAEMAAIERECAEATGLSGEVESLYGGGLYHLYTYKRFEDVRLVFAPAYGVASFGGDVDNFEFPRWNLDVTIVRVYEDGEAYRSPHWLRVSTAGVSEGEPAFVVGHPGRTQRLYTVDHLRYLRDVSYPRLMHYGRTREVELLILASQGPEARRIASNDLGGIQNFRKGLGGKLRALQDPSIFARKVAEERDFRARVEADAALSAEVGAAWEEIGAAMERAEALIDEYRALEGGRPTWGGSELFSIARDIVRVVEEREKPDGERMSGYHESQLPNVELGVYSEAPIYPMLERDALESHLAWCCEVLGGEHPAVVMMLDGKGPRERAKELVEGCGLADVGARRSLMDGGRAAVAASGDAMIRLALEIDGAARAVREAYESEVEAAVAGPYARLASARFAVYGESVYPDATFSLRLATGRVKGFDLEGEWVDPVTDFAGLYARWEEKGPEAPFNLPPEWLAARDRLDLSTAFNISSTNDIIGGNSGSPLVNAAGEFVGIAFDGNRYSFVWDAIYEGVRGRCVSVDARAIVEALEVVYGADWLVEEIMGE